MHAVNAQSVLRSLASIANLVMLGTTPNHHLLQATLQGAHVSSLLPISTKSHLDTLFTENSMASFKVSTMLLVRGIGHVKKSPDMYKGVLPPPAL
jgi:hypothetical protein